MKQLETGVMGRYSFFGFGLRNVCPYKSEKKVLTTARRRLLVCDAPSICQYNSTHPSRYLKSHIGEANMRENEIEIRENVIKVCFKNELTSVVG